jgi:hypothetical protein
LSELRPYLPQLLRLFALLIFLGAALLLLREVRHSIAGFWELIRTAWADEWRGKERAARCNRGGTIIIFTVTLIIFLTQQAHSLLNGEHQGGSTVIWLFISGVAFLTISLLVLANLEKQKMLLDRRRRPRVGRRGD